MTQQSTRQRPAIWKSVDTFTGLPAEQWNSGEVHKPYEFNDTSIESVTAFVNSSNVYLFNGLFPDSGKFAEDYKFSFVHLDVDFYESTKACLDWFLPRMNKGGVIVLDDYDWPNCPGVKKALENIEHYKTNADYQAYIQC
jgi:O-methyltransferase